MAVFLGGDGCIELKRTSLDEPFFTEIDPSDVRPNSAASGLPPAPPLPEWDDSTAACSRDRTGDYSSSDAVDGSGISLCANPAAPAGTTAFDDADLLPRSLITPFDPATGNPHDVTPPLTKGGRLSFDFPHGQYISGDLLDFSSLDGGLLDFLDGWNIPYRTAWGECVTAGVGDYQVSDCDNGTDSICDDAPTYADPPWTEGTSDYDNADVWPRDQINKDFTLTLPEVYDQASFFVHVDETNGMKLYSTFGDAVAGEKESEVRLRRPSHPIQIKVMVENNRFRVLGQVQSFEVNTEREAVDVTELGDSFREQYSGLITGSGSVTCLFEYERRDCDGFFGQLSATPEMPVYLNQLILRSSIGSEFLARLILVKRGAKPGGSNIDIDDMIWQEFEAVITNVGMSFTPGEPVRVTMNYVSTGPIRLHTQMQSDYIMQEQDPTAGRLAFEARSEDGFLVHTDG